jgi:hypothetical protein
MSEEHRILSYRTCGLFSLLYARVLLCSDKNDFVSNSGRGDRETAVSLRYNGRWPHPG